MNKDYLYSYHTFLFPFQWSYKGKGYDDHTLLEEKTALKPFIEILNGTAWERKPFVPDTRLSYNEYNYFYDFVREILYDRKQSDEELAGNNLYMAHYYYKVEPETWDYIITLKDREYKLAIDSIILHLYSTGVGVLSFHLNNRRPDQAAPDDILQINQFGRRIYPPFFGLESNIVGAPAQHDPDGFSAGLKMVQEKEIPFLLTIGDEGHAEDFRRYADPDYFKKTPFQLPRCFQHLFNGIPFTADAGENTGADLEIFISPLLDDRMFVICWYGNDKTVKYELNATTKKRGRDSNGNYRFKSNEFWYKYIFVDGGTVTCQNDEMMQKLVDEHTSARWLNYGTLFGASRYSFVCLTGSLQELRKVNASFIVNHVQTMYYKMVELCLVQRACVLRFKDEVNDISLMKEKDVRLLSQKVQNLYKQYIRFVNKIYFREVTPQEQGIELYDLIQKNMKLDAHVRELDDEIQELHNYVMIAEENKRNRNIAFLTRIATAFVLPGFIAGYLGMNLFQPKQDSAVAPVQEILIILAAMSIIPALLFWWTRGGRGIKPIEIAISVIILLAILIVLPVIMYK